MNKLYPIEAAKVILNEIKLADELINVQLKIYQKNVFLLKQTNKKKYLYNLHSFKIDLILNNNYALYSLKNIIFWTV